MNHLHTDGRASCQTVPLRSSCFLVLENVRWETLRYQSANTSQPPLHKTASFVWWNVPASLGLNCQVLIITNLMLTQPVNHLLLPFFSEKFWYPFPERFFSKTSEFQWRIKRQMKICFPFFSVTVILHTTWWWWDDFLILPLPLKSQHKRISGFDWWQLSRPAWDCSEIILYSYFVVLSWNLTPNWRKFDIKFFRTDSYSIKNTAEWWQDWQDTTPLTQELFINFHLTSFLSVFISARHIIICCKHV